MAAHWIVLLVAAWIVLPLPLAVAVGRAFGRGSRRTTGAAGARGPVADSQGDNLRG